MCHKKVLVLFFAAWDRVDREVESRDHSARRKAADRTFFRISASGRSSDGSSQRKDDCRTRGRIQVSNGHRGGIRGRVRRSDRSWSPIRSLAASSSSSHRAIDAFAGPVEVLRGDGQFVPQHVRNDRRGDQLTMRMRERRAGPLRRGS